MNKTMLRKEDHYLHLRKTVLSTTEFELIHTRGKASVEAPLITIEPVRKAATDIYGNLRQYFLVKDFDEITLRLGFEQGWEEAEYLAYPMPGAKMEEPKYPIASSMKSASESISEFSKLLSKLNFEDKYVFQPKHYMADEHEYHKSYGSYHTPEYVHYAEADAHISMNAPGAQIKKDPTQPKISPLTTKEFFELQKPSSMSAVAAELNKVIYNADLEYKYGIQVSVTELYDPVETQVMVVGKYSGQVMKGVFIVSPTDSFYAVSQKVLQLKSDLIKALEDTYYVF